MTHPLAHVLTHVRAKARPGQYDAILLAEVDRLRAMLRRWSDLDGNTDDIAALIAETRDATKETGDV